MHFVTVFVTVFIGARYSSRSPRTLTSFGLGSLVCMLMFGLGLGEPVYAASTVDTFSFTSPEHEDRYRGLIAEIRCPKCQNVNIAGSDAPIAQDLRITVHRLLSDGMSDQEILDFLQARYGDFVLYDPPLRSNTVVLWLIPLLGFVFILGVVWRLARRVPDASALSADDEQRLQGLLSKTSESGNPPVSSSTPELSQSR